MRKNKTKKQNKKIFPQASNPITMGHDDLHLTVGICSKAKQNGI